MADVSIMCSECGLTFRVSEYALGKPIRCPTCGCDVKTTTASAQSKDKLRPSLNLKLARGATGEQQPAPVPTEQKPKASLISAATTGRPTKGKPGSDEAPPPAGAEEEPEVSLITSINASRHKPIAGEQTTVRAVAGQNVVDFGKERPWPLIIMLIFVPIAAFLRYSAYIPGFNIEIIPEVAMKMISEYGPWLIVAMHLLIIVLAFGESSIDGILCMLVPLFSFYFVLSTGNRPMLRAFLVIAMVFLGYDTYEFTLEKGSKMYSGVNRWIDQSGN